MNNRGANWYEVVTIDRYDRYNEYLIAADTLAEAEAIAAKPSNVLHGSVVMSVKPISQTDYNLRIGSPAASTETRKSKATNEAISK